MVLKTITKKVEGGKLFRIDLDFDSKIEKIKITGDFFLHPEETITDIESVLNGVRSDISCGELKDKIDGALSSRNASLIGVSSDDIANAILEVISNE